MRFDPSLLDQIRARLPISQVVGRRVTYDKRKSQPARGDFWACCPFHKEKTSSFHCDDRRGIYHCFGCGATGDHFKFVTETEGLTFPEAVERLAEEAGVPLPKADPRDREREAVRVDLAGACEIAAKFFEQKLRSPEGKPAREYMLKRGILEKTSIEFRFGYAPDERDALKRHLIQNDVKEETGIAAGLLIKPEDGRASYDRFRGRLMIPIHDERGRVVAFGGRTLDPEGQPKYLNSPETPLFHKGTMLFNVHRAREAAHKSGTIIVTEGYMDAISVYQAGIRNVTAALGTAFTEDHIARLWRFAAEPVICFDGDKAGVSAAHRAIDRILPTLKSGYSFNFCFLPSGQDPDDIVRQTGAVGFMAAVAGAVPLIDVLWEREVTGSKIDTPERRASLEVRFRELIQLIKDPTVKHMYDQAIKIRLSNLFWRADAELRKSKFSINENVIRTTDAKPTVAIGLLGIQRLILGLCVYNPLLFEKNTDSLIKLSFPHRFFVFLQELDRIITDFRDELPTAFYKKLRPEFYEVMAEVHAGTIDAVERHDMTGYKLFEMMPILKLHPGDVFVSDVFDMLMEKLSLASLAEDIESELKLVKENNDDNHADYVLALMKDHHRRLEELARCESNLVENANAIRKENGLGKSGASGTVFA